ncbi:hypothetical protein G9464_16155 [Halostella sp. JP-L12]|uniref:hypothetical protein n=1 Tax=Halostella TaxID=1843185 RepID=UPI000EF833B7|nr:MULTISPECIES: hypothetical protein [Halostella]NHN49114.1 hypothetical protein [Halostella sp. JP-L12]
MLGSLRTGAANDGALVQLSRNKTVLANSGWFVAALLYGYVVYGLLAAGSYSEGPVIALIAAAAFVLFVLGSAHRVRTSTYYEVAAGCLMIGYSVDSLYHRQELLLAAFLVIAVAVFLGESLTASE